MSLCIRVSCRTILMVQRQVVFLQTVSVDLLQCPVVCRRHQYFKWICRKAPYLGASWHERWGIPPIFSWSECPWTRSAQGATENWQGEMEEHLSRGSPVRSAARPGAVTHPPAPSACVTEGESLPASSSCWSLLEGRLLCVCSHPGQSLSWRQDLAVPMQPCHCHTAVGLLMCVKPGPSPAACAWSVRMPP